MSEERFDRIERKLDRLAAGQAGLDTRMAAVESGMGTLESRVGTLESRMDARFDELGRHMRLLHEEALRRIAALREYDGPTKAEMDQGFAELREIIGRRLDPLEATVRQHSKDIDLLKKNRG